MWGFSAGWMCATTWRRAGVECPVSANATYRGSKPHVSIMSQCEAGTGSVPREAGIPLTGESSWVMIPRNAGEARDNQWVSTHRRDQPQ